MCILNSRGQLALHFDTKTSSLSQPVQKLWPIICHRRFKIAYFWPKKCLKLCLFHKNLYNYHYFSGQISRTSLNIRFDIKKSKFGPTVQILWPHQFIDCSVIAPRARAGHGDFFICYISVIHMDFILILSLHFFANNSKISSHGKPNFNLYSLKSIPRSDIFLRRARDMDIFPYNFFENIILMQLILFPYYIKGFMHE